MKLKRRIPFLLKLGNGFAADGLDMATEGLLFSDL